MLKLRFPGLAAIILLAVAVNLAAGGGFYLQLGNPAASEEATALQAALTAQATGCGNPAAAELTATAIGIVDGRRQSVPLRVIGMKKAGMFAIIGGWPEQGRWAIQLVAREGGKVTSAIVPIEGKEVRRTRARFFQGEPPAADLERVLTQATVSD